MDEIFVSGSDGICPSSMTYVMVHYPKVTSWSCGTLLAAFIEHFEGFLLDVPRKGIEEKYKNKLKHYEDIRKGNREMAIDVHPLSVDPCAGLSYASGRDPAAAYNGTLTPKSTPHQPIWLLDSGSPFHVTGDLSFLTNFTRTTSGDQTIRVPHKGRMQVHGIGSVNTPNVVLQNVRYVPDLGKVNLISIGQLTKLGYKVSTGAYGCRISKGSDDNVVGKARFTGDFQFEVEFVKVPPPPAN